MGLRHLAGDLRVTVRREPGSLPFDPSSGTWANLRARLQHLTGGPMEQSQQYRLKFIADDSFVEQLRAYATKYPESLSIQSEAKNKDATRLGFDLAAAADILTLVSGTLYVGELSVMVVKWLRASKSNKIVLQGPFQTLEFHKDAGVTEEDVRKFLKAAQGLH